VILSHPIISDGVISPSIFLSSAKIQLSPRGSRSRYAFEQGKSQHFLRLFCQEKSLRAEHLSPTLNKQSEMEENLRRE